MKMISLNRALAAKKKNSLNRALAAKKKFYLALLSALLLSPMCVMAQSVDFVQLASSLLWNEGNTNKLYDNDNDNGSDYVVAASGKKYNIGTVEDAKNKQFYTFKNIAGLPSADLEFYPNQKWNLMWEYTNDHKNRVGLQARRSGGDNYIGIQNLQVGDIVTVVSDVLPVLKAEGTTATGTEDNTGTTDITFRFGNGNRTYEGAKVYKYTVTAAGQLCLNIPYQTYVYSVSVTQTVEVATVDVDFYAQTRTNLSEGGGHRTNITTYTGTSKIHAGEGDENKTFYTIAQEGFDFSGICVYPNKDFQLSNAYSTDAFSIGLYPIRGDGTNRLGLLNLKAGDKVVIRSIAEPTVYSAEIGSGSAVDDEFTFAYGTNSKRKIATKLYTYNVTSNGNMAWQFARYNTIISVKVSHNEEQAKAVAKKYPVTIANGWATYCAPEDVLVPEGVTAYVGTSKESNVILLEELTDGIIPANCGVVLAGDDNSYNLVSTTDASAATSVLSGTLSRTALPSGTIYCLNSADGEFQQYEGTFIPANKAYYRVATPIAGAPARFGMRIVQRENTTTAIENTEFVPIDYSAPIYNLQGQQVQVTESGIYIQNGRKYLIMK